MQNKKPDNRALKGREDAAVPYTTQKGELCLLLILFLGGIQTDLCRPDLIVHKFCCMLEARIKDLTKHLQDLSSPMTIIPSC